MFEAFQSAGGGRWRWGLAVIHAVGVICGGGGVRANGGRQPSRQWRKLPSVGVKPGAAAGERTHVSLLPPDVTLSLTCVSYLYS